MSLSLHLLMFFRLHVTDAVLTKSSLKVLFICSKIISVPSIRRSTRLSTVRFYSSSFKNPPDLDKVAEEALPSSSAAATAGTTPIANTHSASEKCQEIVEAPNIVQMVSSVEELIRSGNPQKAAAGLCTLAGAVMTRSKELQLRNNSTAREEISLLRRLLGALERSLSQAVHKKLKMQAQSQAASVEALLKQEIQRRTDTKKDTCEVQDAIEKKESVEASDAMADDVPVADEDAGASVAESATVEHESASLPDAQDDIAESTVVAEPSEPLAEGVVAVEEQEKDTAIEGSQVLAEEGTAGFGDCQDAEPLEEVQPRSHQLLHRQQAHHPPWRPMPLLTPRLHLEHEGQLFPLLSTPCLQLPPRASVSRS
jgi:hypothetical protein